MKMMLVRAAANTAGVAFLLLWPVDVYAISTSYVGNAKAGPMPCMLECMHRCPPKRKRLTNGRWRRSTRWALATGKPRHLVPPHYS